MKTEVVDHAARSLDVTETIVQVLGVIGMAAVTTLEATGTEDTIGKMEVATAMPGIAESVTCSILSRGIGTAGVMRTGVTEEAGSIATTKVIEAMGATEAGPPAGPEMMTASETVMAGTAGTVIETLIPSVLAIVMAETEGIAT